MGDWQKLAGQWSGKKEGTLRVMPVEKARFEESNLDDNSVDAVVMMSIISHPSPRMGLALRTKIALEAVRIVRPRGHLIVGWYANTGNASVEYDRTQDVLQKVRDQGYILTEVSHGSEPAAARREYGYLSATHDWICYSVDSDRVSEEEIIADIERKKGSKDIIIFTEDGQIADRMSFSEFEQCAQGMIGIVPRRVDGEIRWVDAKWSGGMSINPRGVPEEDHTPIMGRSSKDRSSSISSRSIQCPASLKELKEVVSGHIENEEYIIALSIVRQYQRSKKFFQDDPE